MYRGPLLGLLLVEVVNLLSHVCDGGVVLLPEDGQRRLVVDVARVQVRLQLGQLLLAAGVEGDLSRRVAAGLLQPLVELVQLPGDWVVNR